MLKHKLLAVAVACSLTLVSGCVSNTSPDERLSNKDANVANSYVTSCLVGAAAAGGVCLLIADKDKRAACIAVAAAGCAVGLAGNALLEHIRDNYKTTEEQLNASIEIIKKNNEKAATFASRATEVYKQEHNNFLALEKDIKAGKADQKKLKNTIAQYDANIKLIKENIEKHESNLADYKNLRSQIVAGRSNNQLTKKERAALANYDKRIKELNTEIENIRKQYLAFLKDRDVLNLAAVNVNDKEAA